MILLDTYHDKVISLLANYWSFRNAKFIDSLYQYPEVIETAKLLAINKIVGRIIDSLNSSQNLYALVCVIATINELSYLGLNSAINITVSDEIDIPKITDGKNKNFFNYCRFRFI